MVLIKSMIPSTLQTTTAYLDQLNPFLHQTIDCKVTNTFNPSLSQSQKKVLGPVRLSDPIAIIVQIIDSLYIYMSYDLLRSIFYFNSLSLSFLSLLAGDFLNVIPQQGKNIL